jgi:hypothetical protein
MRNRFSNRETLNFQIGGSTGANQPNIVATSNMVKPATYNLLKAPSDIAALEELGKAGNVSLSDGTQSLLNIVRAMEGLGIIS